LSILAAGWRAIVDDPLPQDSKIERFVEASERAVRAVKEKRFAESSAP
jgi:hypothetical protein